MYAFKRTSMVLVTLALIRQPFVSVFLFADRATEVVVFTLWQCESSSARPVGTYGIRFSIYAARTGAAR